MLMSWGSFEELKKFARKQGNVKKKRNLVGWQNLLVNKRRRTDSGSLSFVSNNDSGEIEGFSTDEENDDSSTDFCSDSLTKSLLRKPLVKRKYSKSQNLPDKRSPTSSDFSTHTGALPKGAYGLMKYAETSKGETDIIWHASDNKESPQVFSDGSDSDDTEMNFSSNHQGLKPNEGTSDSAREVISDFQSDTDEDSQQESLSTDISTPTPTPVSPMVVGTPRTASEWLKQVHQKSPDKSQEDKSPKGRGAGMNQWDSAKKKKKFARCGLAEQLQQIISREKSEEAFWNHRVKETEYKTATGLSPQMDAGSIILQILSDQLLQGLLHLTQCCMWRSKDSSSSSDVTDPSRQRLLFVLFNFETWKQFALQVGATVRIHPPWQKLVIPGVECPVLLCTHFCHKLTANQLPAIQLQSVKVHRLLIPTINTSPSSSSLLQSPRKGFKPSKLLFGTTEDAAISTQKELALSSLTKVTADTTTQCSSRPHTSILKAIESSGGCSGALVTIRCLVQRVYCKKVKLSRQREDIMRNSGSALLLNQHLKYAAKSLGKVEQEELRWALLVQDLHGVCAEIQVPSKCLDLHDWRSCLQLGEGKVFIFSQLRIQQRTNRIRSPGLFSIIESLYSSKVDNTVSSHNESSQIVSQESGSKTSSPSLPPNFCYVLTVQESCSSCACAVCDGGQEEVFGSGFLHKPCTFRVLRDVLHTREVENGRVSVLCKLMYCRLNEPLSVVVHRRNPFELFLTDCSVESATELCGSTESLSYVKVSGETNHVLPKEVREAFTSCGTILSVTDLLLRAQEFQELVADTYSVVRIAVPSESIAVPPSAAQFHEVHVSQNNIDDLSCLIPAPLPWLTQHSCCGYLYRVEGVVIGIDEESACCWLACHMCGSAEITVKQEASYQYFCSSCNVPVDSPKTKTFLTVLLKVKSFPEANVHVTLQQSTIDRLLPVSYQDSDKGYDIEAVLGRHLQPMSCYVTEHSGHGTSCHFCLEEIHLN